MGMRVGSSRERNPLFHRQPNDFVARIRFADRFAPARRRKFDGETTRANKIERCTGDCFDVSARAMAMDLHQIEVGQAIYQAGARDFANTSKIIRVDRVDVAPLELHRTSRNGVEHLIVPLEEMHGPEYKIESVPMFLDPLSAGGRACR